MKQFGLTTTCSQLWCPVETCSSVYWREAWNRQFASLSRRPSLFSRSRPLFYLLFSQGPEAFLWQVKSSCIQTWMNSSDCEWVLLKKFSEKQSLQGTRKMAVSNLSTDVSDAVPPIKFSKKSHSHPEKQQESSCWKSCSNLTVTSRRQIYHISLSPRGWVSWFLTLARLLSTPGKPVKQTSTAWIVWEAMWQNSNGWKRWWKYHWSCDREKKILQDKQRQRK